MRRVSGSATVAAPVEAVWNLMCDMPRYAEWVETTDKVIDMAQGPIEVGYTYREYGGVPPFKGESDWRVSEFEPMARQRQIGDDGMVITDLSIGLEPRPEGTLLTMTVDLAARWFIAPLNAVLWPLMMRRRPRRRRHVPPGPVEVPQRRSAAHAAVVITAYVASAATAVVVTLLNRGPK